MNYFRVSIKINPFEEWLKDVLMAEFTGIGFESFEETGDGFNGYIPEKLLNLKDTDNILEPYRNNFTFGISSELIPERNWNEEWEKNYFKPLVVAGECLVRAPFHTEYPNCKYEIVIEPNMAFGTGNHETTSMMLEAILKEELTGKKVLDMGCGTGILGILASMKGASEITAIDIDEWAVKGTTENAELNGISNIKVKKGDASLLESEKYDIIFANIHKNILLQDMYRYNNSLKPGGKLFMSGIYLNDLPDIKSKASELNLKFQYYQEKNNWIAVVFSKP